VAQLLLLNVKPDDGLPELVGKPDAWPRIQPPPEVPRLAAVITMSPPVLTLSKRILRLYPLYLAIAWSNPVE